MIRLILAFVFVAIGSFVGGASLGLTQAKLPATTPPGKMLEVPVTFLNGANFKVDDLSVCAFIAKEQTLYCLPYAVFMESNISFGEGAKQL